MSPSESTSGGFVSGTGTLMFRVGSVLTSPSSISQPTNRLMDRLCWWTVLGDRPRSRRLVMYASTCSRRMLAGLPGIPCSARERPNASASVVEIVTVLGDLPRG